MMMIRRSRLNKASVIVVPVPSPAMKARGATVVVRIGNESCEARWYKYMDEHFARAMLR